MDERRRAGNGRHGVRPALLAALVLLATLLLPATATASAPGTITIHPFSSDPASVGPAVFPPGVYLTFEGHLPEGAGALEITVRVYALDPSGERIVGDQRIPVDPDWTTVRGDLGTFTGGRYAVRIYAGAERIAAGGFEIREPDPTPRPTPVPTPPPSPTPVVPDCTAPAAVDPGGWPVPGRAQATGDLIPYVVSSAPAVGDRRLLFTLIDSSSDVIARPDVRVSAALYHLATDPDRPAATVPATYMEPDPGHGLYRIATDLPCAGTWGLEVRTLLDGEAVTSRVLLEVAASGPVPAIGDRAPRSDTPVAGGRSGVGLEEVSTDPDPEPSLYRVSVADAVRSGRPVAILFTTPGLCQTGSCEPMMRLFKAIARSWSDRATFIHVEPYRFRPGLIGPPQPVLDTDGRLQPVKAVREWGLPTEPYLFLVDGDGRVAASFEGVWAQTELTDAIVALGPHRTVRRGDTLLDIAREAGVSQEALICANPEIQRNPNLLSVGQVLLIPPPDFSCPGPSPRPRVVVDAPGSAVP